MPRPKEMPGWGGYMLTFGEKLNRRRRKKHAIRVRKVTTNSKISRFDEDEVIELRVGDEITVRFRDWQPKRSTTEPAEEINDQVTRFIYLGPVG